MTSINYTSDLDRMSQSGLKEHRVDLAKPEDRFFPAVEQPVLPDVPIHRLRHGDPDDG